MSDVGGYPFECSVWVGEHEPVEYAYDGPVGFVVFSSDIDNYEVSVGYFFAGCCFGFFKLLLSL